MRPGANAHESFSPGFTARDDRYDFSEKRLLLPVFVYAIRRWTGVYNAAPYIAGAVLIGCTTIYSFLGHRKFSFRVQ